MILKLILIILTSAWGFYIGDKLLVYSNAPLWGLIGGALIGFLIILIERKIEKITSWEVFGGVAGLIVGLIIANLFSYVFLANFSRPSSTVLYLCLGLNLISGYLGLVTGMKKVKEIDLNRFKIFSKIQHSEGKYKILDTSVIIDGRIFDICESGFIEGTFVIPQFVLQELMRIADSSDPLRRTRGKKGLDTLKKIQKQTNLDVIITDQDFPKIKEVDHKLVALAHKMGGKIITNDLNLNEIAEIQGVTVLNINHLATALKPLVLPGEMMNVYIQKEGKEYGQGVAYLDDGTMIVVKNGKKHIGKNMEVSVTSVLQTTTGRMIFAEVKEDSQPQNVHRLR